MVMVLRGRFSLFASEVASAPTLALIFRSPVLTDASEDPALLAEAGIAAADTAGGTSWHCDDDDDDKDDDDDDDASHRASSCLANTAGPAKSCIPIHAHYRMKGEFMRK